LLENSKKEFSKQPEANKEVGIFEVLSKVAIQYKEIDDTFEDIPSQSF
jgi:hypothetical protein